MKLTSVLGLLGILLALLLVSRLVGVQGTVAGGGDTGQGKTRAEEVQEQISGSLQQASDRLAEGLNQAGAQ